MGFSLKNLLNQATAQVNPFDNGATAATVRKQQSLPPARPPVKSGYLQVAQVQRPQLVTTPSIQQQPTHVTVAAPQNLQMGNTTFTPTPQTQTAPTGLIKQTQQKLTQVQQHAPDMRDPVSKLAGFVGREFIAKPAAEIAASVTNTPVVPSNPVSKWALGDTPIKPIQQDVAGTYNAVKAGHQNLPGGIPISSNLAAPYAAANAVMHLANDLPLVGTTGKTLVKGVEKGAKLAEGALKGSTVAKALTSNAPRVSITDQQVLRDYADALSGAYKPKPSELSNLIANARQVGAKHGVDLVNGSMADKLDRATGVLDQVGTKKFGITPLNEIGAVGKDVRTPFTAKTGDKLVDTHPKKQIVNMTPDEYLQQAFNATDGKLGGGFDSWLNSNRHDAGVAKKYAEAMQKGDKFPVPFIDNARGMQDGRNRAIAAKLAGEKTIPVAVVPEMTPVEKVAFYKSELDKATTPYMKHVLQNKLDIAQSQVPKPRFGLKPLNEKGAISLGGDVNKAGEVPVVSTRKAVARNVQAKTDQQLLPQEQLRPQTELVKPLETSTPISSQGVALANNTTKVKLNTGRMELTKAGSKNLEQGTSEVIAKMPFKDIQQIARNAGLDTKTHTEEQTRKIIAEQLNVRRDAVKLQNEAEIARKSGDTKTAEQLLAQSAERGRISRTQGTDIARQLAARRIIANELDTPQQRIFKLLDNAGVNPDVYVKRLANVDFNDPNDVVKAYRDLVPAKASEWVDTVRYNSMLSSPLTHVINSFSNAVNVGVVAPVEKTVRGMIDAAGGLFGHERQFAAGEGAAYAKGAVTNIREAANNFVDAMRGTPQNFNQDLLEYNTPLAIGGAKGATYNVLSYPMRMLGASDKFFRTLAAAGEENALALRASKGIRVNGDIKALGQGEADYRLFQQDSNLGGQGSILESVDSVTNALMKLRKDHTWARFVFPFVKTPTNILKQGIEYSPLGFANAVKAEDKITAATRAAIGTAVFGAAWTMVSTGDTTWGTPTNKAARDRFVAEGKQPYAIRLGGHWFGFSKLPPAISFPFALAAALNDAKENAKIGDGTIEQIMTAVAKYGQFLGDQSYVKNIGDTLAAFKGDSQSVVTAVSNYPQQVIPLRALTGWFARMTDDKERQINTDKGFIDKQVQALMLNYPGLRQHIDTRNYQGAPIPANNPVINSFSPVKVTDVRPTSPIDAAKDAAKQLDKTNPDIPKNLTKTYTSFIDSEVSQAQNELIGTPEYQGLDTKARAKALDSVKSKYTSAYKRQFMAKNNLPISAAANSSDIKILQDKAPVAEVALTKAKSTKAKTTKVAKAKTTKKSGSKKSGVTKASLSKYSKYALGSTASTSNSKLLRNLVKNASIKSSRSRKVSSKKVALKKYKPKAAKVARKTPYMV